MSVVIMEEVKSKIPTQFKTLERSEKDSIKILARNKDSEVQKHVSYIEQRLDTIQDMKYGVQEIMIVDNVEDAIVGEWVSITNQKMERYQELVQKVYARRKKQKSERKYMRCKKRGSKEEWKKS